MDFTAFTILHQKDLAAGSIILALILLHLIAFITMSIIQKKFRREADLTSKTKTGNKFVTIPNLLSISRIVGAPYIAYVILRQEYTYAVGLLYVFGMTDYLDGKIASIWPSQQSAIGGLLDPVGDKILVVIVSAALSYNEVFPRLFSALITLRHIFVVSLMLYTRRHHCPPPVTIKRFFDPSVGNLKMIPTTMGKISSDLEISVIWASICASILDCVDHPWIISLYIISATASVWSGASYIVNENIVKVLKTKKS